MTSVPAESVLPSAGASEVRVSAAPLRGPSRGGRLGRLVIVVAGIVLSQAILYGPSLVGSKVLLPLDILASKTYYMPHTSETRDFRPQNRILSDEVLAIEFRRRFAAEEVRAGRLPLWNPYNYCGAPFMAANNTAVFSPFRLLDYLFPGPWTIAWVQLLKSVVGALGAFLFFRRAMGVGFWPAALGAWCFPLLGFLILWRGYPPSHVAVWLPWALYAVDSAVRRPWGWGGAGLAIVTACIMLSGHAATGAHVLLASGLYCIWCLFHDHGSRGITVSLAASIAAAVAGWLLGFGLSAPQNLPTAEYLRTSNRVARRQEAKVEVGSIGALAVPQFVLPYCHGASDRWSRYLIVGNRQEGAPAGYAGFLVALFLAPLAWCRTSERSRTVFWIVLGLFAASAVLGIPIVVELFSYFPFTLLKNNRFVLVTAWCVLALGVTGLEALRRGEVRPRRWHVVPLAVIVLLGAFCFWRAGTPPPGVDSLSQLQERLRINEEEALVVQRWFTWMYIISGVLCVVAAALWLAVFVRVRWRAGLLATVALLVLAELIATSYGVSPQCDPALYYPASAVPVLEYLQHAPPGRICGWYCLPACLNQVHHLRDIRGYDGADPAHLVELLALCQLQFPRVEFHRFPYAAVQWFPAVPSPILDMLGVRYRVLRGVPQPSDQPLVAVLDYYVVENPSYVARVHVPRRVETVVDKRALFQRLIRRDFDPRHVAYVDAPVDLPSSCHGTARIVAEVPSEVTIDLDMRTPGLVVLSDLWYTGWKAYLNDREVPILRTNYALRGVVVAAGKGRLVFRYWPESFERGLWWMGGSLIVLMTWCVIVRVLLPPLRRTAVPLRT